jgi:hypothetical protein
MYQWCGFKSSRVKNNKLTALKSNSNTVWFNSQTYILFSINLVSFSNFEIHWDRYIIWFSLASRNLNNTLYFLWLHNEFFIILYNILTIAELNCCQIIILSIYVPSTHAYTHNQSLSLDLPYEKRYHYDYWSSFFREWMWSSDLERWM